MRDRLAAWARRRLANATPWPKPERQPGRFAVPMLALLATIVGMIVAIGMAGALLTLADFGVRPL